MQVSVTNNHGIIAEKIEGGSFNIAPSEVKKVAEGGEMPSILNTDEAKRLWQIAQEHGFVDEAFMPKMSQQKAAMLASVMADILSLSPRWSPFEQLWGIKDLATKLSVAQVRDYYASTMKEYEMALTI